MNTLSRPLNRALARRHSGFLWGFAWLPVAALVFACDSPAAPDEGSIAAIVSARVDTTTGPLVRTLVLRLDAPSAVEVDYWADSSRKLRIGRDVVADSQAIVLARLRPGRSYHYEVRAVASNGRRGAPFSGQFATGLLPPDLAALSFDATGQREVPLVLVHLFTPDGFKGYAVLDGAGHVVWYYRTAGLPFGVTHRANGNLVVMDKARGLIELTPAGVPVHELAQDSTARNLHHDVLATPDNSILFIAQDAKDYDGRSIVGEAIWEWYPETGETVKRWSSHDFLDPATDWGSRSTDGDWLHANALDIGERGNIILSLRRLNQVLSIAPDWSRLEWRLGGVGATIPVEEGEQFTGQHTAAEVGPNRILLFDNHYELGGYSRAVEFDLSSGVAEKVWEWRPERDNFAFAVSSARRLASGNTLVGFGMSPELLGSTGPIEVYEVTTEGEVLWHLVITGTRVMYRAEPLETIAGEYIVGH